MSAYTKGPWLFSEDRRGRKRVFAEDSEIVRALSTHGARRVSLDERHANARLIAAAPELLEALKASVASASPRVRAYYRPGEDCTELVEETTWEPWVVAARAVIAKAEGK